MLIQVRYPILRSIFGHPNQHSAKHMHEAFSVSFGVSIYRAGCPNFIAFVLKIGLEYVKASFNNNYGKHSVLKQREDLLVPVQVAWPGTTLGLQRCHSEKKWPLLLLCLPLPCQANLVFGICELGKVVLG